MRRVLRQPLLHFALIGGLLFAAEHAWRADAPAPADAVITVDAAMQANLHAAWRRQLGRAPADAEWQAQLARAVDDELLLAEALRLELDGVDPVARARLLANMRFAFPERRASEDALLFEARALGMSRSDPVVRRRLLQVMERRVLAPAVPDEATLRAYVQDHGTRYAGPARHGFRQIWFADADDPRIAAVQAELARGGVPRALGDAFPLGARQPPASEAELARRYGSDFAHALAAVPAAQWVGPLRSAFGMHFVFVESRVEARSPDLARVGARAATAWAVAQRDERRQAALPALRARYRVERSPFAAGAESG